LTFSQNVCARGDLAWRDLLEAHDKTVRRELSRFRGKEVKSLGDGFLATFDGPARAIHRANAIRELLALAERTDQRCLRDVRFPPDRDQIAALRQAT
jgi:class 3 adenylate cyclase